MTESADSERLPPEHAAPPSSGSAQSRRASGGGWNWRSRTLRSLPLGAYVFLGVFVVRLIVLVRLTGSPFLLPAQGDMHFYNEWAQRILRGEWTDYRAFYGLPLYAYLLAGLYTVFGFSPFIPGVVQACLEGGTAAIVFSLGRRIFGCRAELSQGAAPLVTVVRSAVGNRGTVVGLLAAGAWAFYVPAQSYSVILMPTAWLVFVFWWVVWQVVGRSLAPSASWFLLMGLVIGITAMGIATILFLIPLLLGALLFRWKRDETREHRWRQTVLAALLLATGLMIGTSPAWVHNYFVARDPVFLSAHSGVNLWIGNNPGANGYPRFPMGLRAAQQAMLQDSITGAEAAAGRPLKRSEVSKYWSAKAKTYIAENPGAWLKLLGAKIANFWNSFQYDDLSVITSLREQEVTFPGIRFGIVAALGLSGMALAVRRFPASRWVVAAILLHLMSLLSVFVTERYRLAAVPGLLVFAAFAVWALWEAVAGGRHVRAIVCILLLIGSSFMVSARRGDAELWALDNYNSGLQAFESGRVEVAERKLKLALAYVPENAELNFALGNLYLARGDRDLAKAFYRHTVELDPQHIGVFNNLGVLALQQGHWPAAVDFLARAIALEPGDAKTHYLLATAYLRAGNIPSARTEIDRAIALVPTQPEFLQLKKEIAKASGAE